MSAHEIEAKVSNFRMLLLRQTPLTAASPLATNGPSHLHRHLPNGLLSTRAALQFLKAETRKLFCRTNCREKRLSIPIIDGFIDGRESIPLPDALEVIGSIEALKRRRKRVENHPDVGVIIRITLIIRTMRRVRSPKGR
ncbi:Uncharacterized protein FKW44_022048, partial [Caligus rogercresseyi]